MSHWQGICLQHTIVDSYCLKTITGEAEEGVGITLAGKMPQSMTKTICRRPPKTVKEYLN